MHRSARDQEYAALRLRRGRGGGKSTTRLAGSGVELRGADPKGRGSSGSELGG